MGQEKTSLGKGAPKGFSLLLALVLLGVPSLGLLLSGLVKGNVDFIFENFYSLLIYFGVAGCTILITFLGEKGIIRAGRLTEFSVYKKKKKNNPEKADDFVNSIEDLNRLKASGEITDEQYDFYKKKLMEAEFKKQSARLTKNE